MSHFILEQDKRVLHTAIIEKLSTIHNYAEAVKGNVDQMRPVSVAFVNPGEHIIYPGVLDRQLFMVDESIKDVFDLFLPNLEYRVCCLLDNKYHQYHYYYLPLLQTLSPSEITTLGRYTHIFRTRSRDEYVTVVSLAVTEAILRRKPVAVHIKPYDMHTGN